MCASLTIVHIALNGIIIYDRSWTIAAFEASVKAGNDEIVNYFLHNFHEVIDEAKKVQCMLHVICCKYIIYSTIMVVLV